MNTFFTKVRQTLVPRGEVKHGPLPPLLVAMTLITGLVDAFSSFVLGSFGGGLLGSRLGQHRGRLLSVAAALQTLLLGASVVLAALSGNPVSTGYSYSLIIVLGIAMGLQNATARKLGVPDLTTTVLTLTIVGIAADSRLVGESGSRAGRRLISVAAMFVGALVGSLLIFHLSIVYPLVIALIVIAIIAVTTGVLSRTNPIWVRAR